MKRLMLFWTAVFVLFLCVHVKSFAETDPKCRVKVAGIVGTVEVKLKGEDDWKAAALNQCLKIGDWVRTKADGKVALAYDDEDVQVRLNALTTLQVNSEDPEDKEGKEGKEGKKERNPNRFHMDAGQAWAKVAKKEKTFSIKTPTAQAGVRGTEFDVQVDEDGKSVVHVLDGVVSILNDLGEVLAKAGEMTQVLKDALPETPFDFDLDEFKGKLDEWKDKINIGKILDAKLNEVKDKVNEVKDSIPTPKKIKGKFGF